MARRRDPYLDQAQLEADLQINPQMAALASLLAGRKDEYIQTRRVNASNARGIAEAANRAGLQVSQAYGGDPSNPQAGSLLAALKGSTGNPEGQAAYNRLAGEQARSQGLFAEQAGRAELGRQYGNMQARDDYFKTKRQIEGSAQDLVGQHGQLAAATFNKLVEARRERQADRNAQDRTIGQQERSSQRSAGIDPDTGLPIPGGPLDVNDPRDKDKSGGGARGKTGLKLASQEQHSARSEYIGTLVNEAQIGLAAAKRKGLTGKAARAFVADFMTQEQPETTVWKNKKGKTRTAPPPTQEKDQWTPVKVPGIKARPKDLWMTAALDSIFDQGLSRSTQERLQRRYSVRDLGFGQGGNYGMTYGERRKRFGRGRGGNLSNSAGGRGPQGLPG